MKVKNYKVTAVYYCTAYFRYFKSIFLLYIKMDGKTVCPTEILVNS